MKRIIAYLENENTKNAVTRTIADNMLYYQGINTKDKIQDFTGLLYNQFVMECVQNNQYVSLSNETIEKINQIYKELILQLRTLSYKNISLTDVGNLVSMHRKKLINAIKENNYQDQQDQLYIPCAEYTGEFQKRILRLTSQKIIEPIIDIGCGKQYTLVKQFLNRGYTEVHGIDQYISCDSRIICSNWFDYYFCKNTWGTIISHMAFTNHFRRALINRDESREQYEKKYNEILESLMVNGRFIYSPSIRSIEDQIDKDSYHIEYYKNTNDIELDTVCVQRLF